MTPTSARPRAPSRDPHGVTDERAERPRVRTVFLGSGRFGLPALRRLIDHPGIELVGLITAPPRPAGRRGDLRPTAIDEAGPAGVPILTPARLRSAEALADVEALDPGLAVLADYGQIVPAPILDLPFGALNLHPSLLPRHRGATPIPSAILADDPETGVTLFRMDAGLDTGPIIASRRARLDDTDTGRSLHARLSVMAADLLSDSIDGWLAGDLVARPQTETGATLTRPLRREDGRLDPTRPAVELERQVRAFDPWPGAFVDLDKGRLIIHTARAAPAVDGQVGTFDAAGIVTASGLLRLVDVQPAGGRQMPWDAYVRGRPAIVGSRVVPAS
jgi:methionyl-tRNA formyltransferase